MNNFEWIPYLYAVLWTCAFYFYWKSCGKKINAGCVVLGVWMISAWAGAWYENNLIFEHIHKITLTPYLYLFSFSFLLCIPVLQNHTEKIKEIKANEHLIDICIYAIALINVLPFAENLIHFIKGFAGGQIFDLDAFNAKYEEGQIDTYFMSRIGQICEQLADALRLLALVVFFHYFRRPTELRSRKLLLCLLITVCNIVLMGINSGSRNTLFTYIVTSVLIYVIFSKFYSEQIKKRIKKIALFFVASVVALFSIISIVRFDELSSTNSDAKSLGQWLAAYAGESHGIFNADTWYLNENEYKNCDFVKYFYLYKTFGIIDKPHARTPYSQKFVQKNVQFSTVIGTYYTNYGIEFTTCASIIVFLIFSSLLKTKSEMYLSDILFFVYYAKIPLLGFSIFCYMFDGWQLLLVPLMVIYLKMNKS